MPNLVNKLNYRDKITNRMKMLNYRDKLYREWKKLNYRRVDILRMKVLTIISYTKNV